MKRCMLLLPFLGLPCLLLANDAAEVSCDSTASGDCCVCSCQHCGCKEMCHKVCHVVCSWKDVKETVFECRCKDVCIPGPSEKQCTQVDHCDPYGCPLFHDYKPLYTLWNPSQCARPRTVTQLVMVPVTRKVPTYTWVTEYCCSKCSCEVAQTEAQAQAEAASAETFRERQVAGSAESAIDKKLGAAKAGEKFPDAKPQLAPVQQVANVEISDEQLAVGAPADSSMPASEKSVIGEPPAPSLPSILQAK
jgi:hypothetical protein